jgi:hypothetical protein
MAAKVKIFRDSSLSKMEKEINNFLKTENLSRDQITIKQSQSTIPDVATCTITLLYDNKK